MPSIRECRQPYLLSNFDLVTESLTLIAGKRSEPSLSISYRRWTPVVVSSVTPISSLAILVQRSSLSASEAWRTSKTIRCSVEWAVAGSGASPVFSASTPRWTSIVASPPSSRIMLANVSAGHCRICWVHHQYSSSDSPFQAKTGTPAGASTLPSGPTTTAAAAWSWVEKMLQEAQRTSAPRATRVSIRTAVCTVMCSEPATRAPASGLSTP